jgi:hypothetical protein
VPREPRCPDAQEPRCPKVQMHESPDSREPMGSWALRLLGSRALRLLGSQPAGLSGFWPGFSDFWDLKLLGSRALSLLGSWVHGHLLLLWTLTIKINKLLNCLTSVLGLLRRPTSTTGGFDCPIASGSYRRWPFSTTTCGKATFFDVYHPVGFSTSAWPRSSGPF